MCSFDSIRPNSNGNFSTCNVLITSAALVNLSNHVITRHAHLNEDIAYRDENLKAPDMLETANQLPINWTGAMKNLLAYYQLYHTQQR